jgi:hypothetical protein
MKKLISILIVLSLMMTFIPRSAASTDAEGLVFVSGVSASGDGYNWHGGNLILTLTDLVINTSYHTAIRVPNGTQLILNGVNEIEGGTHGIHVFDSHGLGLIIIRGTGTLKSIGGSYGIECSTLNINGGRASFYGTTATTAIKSNTVNFNGGSLYAQAATPITTPVEGTVNVNVLSVSQDIGTDYIEYSTVRDGDLDLTSATDSISDTLEGWEWNSSTDTLTLRGAYIIGTLTVPDGARIVLFEFSHNIITDEPLPDNATFTRDGTQGGRLNNIFAQAVPNSPSLSSAAVTSITLSSNTAHEYRKGTTGAWQDSSTFTGLTPNTSYTFYVRLKETSTHFTSPISVGATFTTNSLKKPHPVTVTGITIADKLYDGTDIIEVIGVEFEVEFSEGLTPSYSVVSARITGNNHGVGTRTAEVIIMLTGADSNDFVLTNPVFIGEVNVVKANASSIDRVFQVKENVTDSYEFNLHTLLPVLPAGQSFGDVAFYSSKGSIEVKENKSILTFLSDGACENINITIQSSSFKISDATITVTAVNEPVNITGVTVNGKIFDGTPIFAIGTPNVPVVYDWFCHSSGQSLPYPPFNAGEYTLILTHEISNVTHSVPFVISPRTVTITANNIMVKTGDSIPTPTVSISGLLDCPDNSHKLTGLTFINMITDSDITGTYAIVPSGATVANGGSNYHVVFVKGILTVTQPAPPPIHTHSWSSYVVTKLTTCISAGIEMRSCNGCSQTQTRAIAVNMNAHSFSEWEVGTPPTHVYEGLKIRVCHYCNKEEKKELPLIEPPTEEPPTEAPPEIPTEPPTEAPTEEPPTEIPTEPPTEAPPEVPTEPPTEIPTEEPTELPTEEPPTEFPQFKLGRILPDDDRAVTIEDALELLKFLARIKDNAISINGNGSREWHAALITPTSQKMNQPRINDALEILKHLAGISKIN